MTLTRERIERYSTEIDRLLAMPQAERSMATYQRAERLIAIVRKLNRRAWDELDAKDTSKAE